MMKFKDCVPEKSFWVNHGPILKNVAELPSALRKMGDKTFQHHVSPQKNDFAKWIREVFGEKNLAEALAKAKNKENMIRAIEYSLR